MRNSHTGCDKFIFSAYTVFGSRYWCVMEALGCDLGSVLHQQEQSGGVCGVGSHCVHGVLKECKGMGCNYILC